MYDHGRARDQGERERETIKKAPTIYNIKNRNLKVSMHENA